MNTVNFVGWHKAKASDPNGCVEVGYARNLRGIRDTMLDNSPVIVISSGTFKVLADELRAGRLHA
jgi:hypothetical protein